MAFQNYDDDFQNFISAWVSGFLRSAWFESFFLAYAAGFTPKLLIDPRDPVSGGSNIPVNAAYWQTIWNLYRFIALPSGNNMVICTGRALPRGTGWQGYLVSSAFRELIMGNDFLGLMSITCSLSFGGGSAIKNTDVRPFLLASGCDCLIGSNFEAGSGKVIVEGVTLFPADFIDVPQALRNQQGGVVIELGSQSVSGLRADSAYPYS